MLQFQKVKKEFSDDITAVDDINFNIDEGEFVFLIGPSGSGKTTLIQMMIRDIKPSEGKIFLHDKDITRISRKHVYKLRRQIGVVFQDYKLIPHKTAYENIEFAMEAAGRQKHEIRETVPYVLEVVGLQTRGEAFPEELSGGEQQRVAIARAMANNPRLLIADEPTGNLDPASAWDIIQILQKINNWGTTVIMSTHGTEIVNTLSKRVIQMEDGRIVRDDNEGGYEFGDIQNFESKKQKVSNVAKNAKSKGKTVIKVNLNEHMNNNGAEEGYTEEEQLVQKKPKRSFISRLFGRSEEEVTDEIMNEDTDEVLEEEDREVIEDFVDSEAEDSLEEVLDTDENKTSQQTQASVPGSDVIHDVEKEKEKKTKRAKNPASPRSKKATAKKTTKAKNKKTKKTKKAPKKKTLNTELDLDLDGDTDEEDTELQDIFDKIKNDSIEVLDVDSEIKSLMVEEKFKTIGDLVQIGPEELQKKLGLSEEEIEDVSAAIQGYINN